ncbi:MAG TPA: hypothetical protein ENH91_05960 [Leeuwenhoekiella sp.]|nr:hypothetical protein [Leeuwenhoekiella sp.]
MNRVKATISALETSGSITLVSLEAAADIALQLLLIDTPETAPYLKTGNSVTAFFKETEVILATASSDSICIPNQIPAKISQLEQERFLTRVHLDTVLGPLAALVNTHTLTKMKLQIGSEVTALVKMNEIMLGS